MRNTVRLLIIFAFLMSNFFVSAQAFAQDKLIFAIDLIRPGDRTPTIDIPKSSYQWQEGLGQLTAQGMQQEYLLGVKLRKLYVDNYHLLPAHYTSGTLYVRSNDADRSLISAQAFLQGLYPLGTGPKLPGTKQFALPKGLQLIPVHTVAKEQDNLLAPWTESAKFKEYVEQYIYPTKEWRQKAAELRPKFYDWSKATGIDITDLYQLKSLGDTLSSYKNHKRPLPSALSAEDVNQIIEAGQWVFLTAFKSPIMGEKTGNALLGVISDYLQQASQEQMKLKYIVLSGQDSTQLSLLSAMSVPLKEIKEIPRDASNLNISLFKKGKQNYYVKITMNDKPVLIPSCGGDSCSLTQFKDLLKVP